MDILWAFRDAYEHARKLKVAQDDYCVKATQGDWTGLGDFPEDLQWEALVDVLRGRVKVRPACRLRLTVTGRISAGSHSLLRDSGSGRPRPGGFSLIVGNRTVEADLFC